MKTVIVESVVVVEKWKGVGGRRRGGRGREEEGNTVDGEEMLMDEGRYTEDTSF